MSEDVWTWLKACRQCGVPHQWRWTCSENHEHGGRDVYKCMGGTWADPTDNHPYQARLQLATVERLQREFDAEGSYVSNY